MVPPENCFVVLYCSHQKCSRLQFHSSQALVEISYQKCFNVKNRHIYGMRLHLLNLNMLQLSERTASQSQLLSAVTYKLIFSSWPSNPLSPFLLAPRIQPPLTFINYIYLLT